MKLQDSMNFHAPNLKFKVENLGTVHQGKFVHKPLTIFCGANNTGKTWTLYALYHFYKYFIGGREDLIEGGNDAPDLADINEWSSSLLPDFFNVPEFGGDDVYFGLIDADDLESAVSFASETEVFLMPAERNGLHLLFRELSSRRTALLHHVSRGTIDINDLLRDVIYSRYAEPIADYIDWLNRLWQIQRGTNGRFQVFAEHLKRRLAEGAYRIDPRTGSIEFRPYRTVTGGRNTTTLGLHVTSSAVKSLFSLWFYLQYQAEPGNVLMVDEPELNLHPGRQRQVARLISRLVNAGINVVISTHSDYIVREFNSMIMLHQQERGQRRPRFGYRADEILDPALVGAYLFEHNTIMAFNTSPEEGINATTFDDVIESMNATSSEIYFRFRGTGNRTPNN